VTSVLLSDPSERRALLAPCPSMLLLLAIRPS
jgi:hypothetical protein